MHHCLFSMFWWYLILDILSLLSLTLSFFLSLALRRGVKANLVAVIRFFSCTTEWHQFNAQLLQLKTYFKGQLIFKKKWYWMLFLIEWYEIRRRSFGHIAKNEFRLDRHRDLAGSHVPCLNNCGILVRGKTITFMAIVLFCDISYPTFELLLKLPHVEPE